MSDRPASDTGADNWFDRWFPTAFLKVSVAWHLLGVVALVVAPQRWPIIVAALVADHAFIAVAGLWPRSGLLGPNLRRLPEGHASRGEVALTFDDGPHPEATPEVLEILERWNAKATFFCVGQRAEAHPELVAEIARRGHRVENHSYGHSNGFALFGPRRTAREIDRAQEVLGRCAGSAPVYFRAPAGIRSPWLHAVLTVRGLGFTSWTRRGFDTVTRDPETVVRRLTRRLAGGDVLLLHDASEPCADSGRPVVLEALPKLLAEIDSRNLRAIALPRDDADPAS